MFQRMLNIFVLVVSLIKSDLMVIPGTFFLPEFIAAESSPSNNYNYISFKSCLGGVGKNNQLKLSILLKRNNAWDPAEGVVFLQLSKCKDNFTDACVFATNYQWGINPIGYPTIIYDLTKACPDINSCVLYIRSLAYSVQTLFTIELTFTNNETETYQNWTTNYPFDGPKVVNKVPISLSQYWRSSAYITTMQDEGQYFALGYCYQGTPINSIEIASTSPVDQDTTLVQQYVCPQTVGNYTDCTPASAQQFGWRNDQVAPFNVVTCTEDTSKSLANGIYILVTARGPGDDGKNTYVVQAMINPDT